MDLGEYVLQCINTNNIIETNVDCHENKLTIVKDKLKEFFPKEIKNKIKISPELPQCIIEQLQNIVIGDKDIIYYPNIIDDIKTEEKNIFGLTSSGLFPYLGQECYILHISPKKVEYTFPSEVIARLDVLVDIFTKVKAAFMCEADILMFDMDAQMALIETLPMRFHADLFQCLYLTLMHIADLANPSDTNAIVVNWDNDIDDDYAEMHEILASKLCDENVKLIKITDWYEYVKLETADKILARKCIYGSNVYLPLTQLFLTKIGGFVAYTAL